MSSGRLVRSLTRTTSRQDTGRQAAEQSVAPGCADRDALPNERAAAAKQAPITEDLAMRIGRIALFALMFSWGNGWLLAESTLGQSLGCWRMPSTALQWLGCGNGPGHHAPVVRARRYHPPHVQRIVRTAPGCQPYCQAPGNSYSSQPHYYDQGNSNVPTRVAPPNVSGSAWQPAPVEPSGPVVLRPRRSTQVVDQRSGRPIPPPAVAGPYRGHRYR